MKLWFKFSAGILFGLALYAVSPQGSFVGEGAIALASTIAHRLGTLIIMPLLCVNIALSLVKLEEDKIGWSIFLRSSLFHLVSLFVATAAGIAAALIADPSMIAPVASGEIASRTSLGALLLNLVPSRISSLFDGSMSAALPACLFAFAAGLAMAHDPAAARPVVTFLDSLSRILNTVNTFFTEILGALLIPMGAFAIYSLVGAMRSSPAAYPRFLAFSSMGFALVAIPTAVFFLKGKRNPLPVLYSSLPGALSGGVSGDLGFAAGVIIRQARENLGVKRRYHTTILATGMFLGRVGTAFVTSSAAVAILASHSPLAINASNLALIFALTPLATIAASFAFGSGPLSSIAYFTILFGRGYENGSLSLSSIAFPLAVSAVLIDSFWLGISQALAGGKGVPREVKNIAHFI